MAKVKVPEPRKLPSGNWFIQLRLGGKSYSFTDKSKSTCKNKAGRFKTSYNLGLIEEKRETNKTNDTLEKVIQDYIDSRKATLSPSTITGYQQILRNRLFKYKKISPTAIKDWQQVIDDEVDDGVSAKTIKNTWSLVAASLKRAKISVPTVTLPKVMPAVRPWLDADQIPIFVKAVKGNPCEISALLALHSLRRSEILYLSWDNIDLDKGLIHVEGTAVPGEKNELKYRNTTKTAKSHRTVPIMIPELKTALEAIPEEKRQGRIYNSYQNLLWEQINEVCDKAGLPRVGVHGLRHSFASLAHHVGLDELTAMQLGGWERAETMHRIYVHIAEKDRLDAVNKMAEFYGFSQSGNENANDDC